jgi:hypothetical protein
MSNGPTLPRRTGHVNNSVGGPSRGGVHSHEPIQVDNRLCCVYINPLLVINYILTQLSFGRGATWQKRIDGSLFFFVQEEWK